LIIVANMHLISFLGFVSVVVAVQTYGPQAAGQTFLIMPQRIGRSWQTPATRMVRSSWAPRVLRSSTSRMSRSLGLPSTRLLRSFATHPGMSTEDVINQEFNEQRVLRTPISRTMTVLPNEVTRITRNIATHMPMVHERVKNFYGIEDINKKKIIHHFVQPVQNNHLGIRQGRASQQSTQHVFSNGGYQPSNFIQGAQEIGGEDVMVDESDLNQNIDGLVGDLGATTLDGYVDDNLLVTDFQDDATLAAPLSGCGWEVLQAETCRAVPLGQSVRPQCACACQGILCDDSFCNNFQRPNQITC